MFVTLVGKYLVAAELPMSVPAAVCYNSHWSTSFVFKVWGYRTYDESFYPRHPQCFTPPPPFSTVFQASSWKYRVSYPGIRPPELEADHSELVPKLTLYRPVLLSGNIPSLMCLLACFWLCSFINQSCLTATAFYSYIKWVSHPLSLFSRGFVVVTCWWMCQISLIWYIEG
jgi:hypothetical protein